MNTILPLITEFLIGLERWDFQSTVVTQMIWRNFIAKEFNIIMFFLINFDLIMPIEIIPDSKQVVVF